MSESSGALELGCRNTWESAGTSGQTLAHWSGELTVNFQSEPSTDTQKQEIFPTGLGWTVACVIPHLGYNVKPAVMETNSSQHRKEHPVLS